ncbi:hypothetical protein [Deinococcus maricopensis]|uniref:hypothetical protein n=1 Tax=Deinococcus maricopensis TaxID=309887 RepID=UPI0005C1E282|nr:hypothetical protein [Deinococcus maricopensis]
MNRVDLNALMRDVQDAARVARRLARAGGNAVAERSAEQFEQGAADAYRSKNEEHLQNNLTALRALAEALRASDAKA